MKTKFLLFAFLLIIFCHTFSVAQSDYKYISPKPGSILNARGTSIIIKNNTRFAIDITSSNTQINIQGSKSGVHTFSTKIVEEGYTLILFPTPQFTEGEIVTVSLPDGINLTTGAKSLPLTFSFTITPLKEKIVITENIRSLIDDEYAYEKQFTKAGNKVSSVNKVDTLPSDFPQIRIDTLLTTAPGYIWMTVSSDAPGVGFYSMVLKNDGSPYKYFKNPYHYSYGLRLTPNGNIAYTDIRHTYLYAGGGESIHRLLDTNFAPVDSFQCGNGYTADSHDFQLLPNGHFLIVAYDLQPIDMSKIVVGGNPGAFVYGSILQELDYEKNVIFQWRSWDYIPITDSYQTLTGAGFDYIHVNAIDMDTDGNILISSRLTCEITKINRATGEIMWRLGGKNNQFAFINEHAENAPTYFTHQHSLKRLPNGNIFFLDNGNLHTPTYSRVVEYKLDEIAKTCTLVWEYRRPVDIFAPTQGSVQRLPNGNTFIGWGSASLTGQRSASEVTPNKSVVFELSILGNVVVSANAYRYIFPGQEITPEVRLYDLLPGNLYHFKNATLNTGVSFQVNQLVGGYNTAAATHYIFSPQSPVFPSPLPVLLKGSGFMQSLGISLLSGELRLDTTWYSGISDPQNLVIYLREFKGQGMFFPLSTTYDPQTKELVGLTTKLGEFVVGRIHAQAIPGNPILVYPENNAPANQNNPVKLAWSSRGITNSFALQVSTDSLFSTFVVNEINLPSAVYPFTNFAQNSKYYWRVKGTNELGTSGWSTFKAFRTTPSLISVSAPNGGEKWNIAGKYNIKWIDNITDMVKIYLVKNDGSKVLVKDSVSEVSGYGWKIPPTVTTGAGYKIRVVNYSDSTLYDESDSSFTVLPAVGISDSKEIVNNFELSDNYPNPFNPSTVIRFQIPIASHVSLKVYDILGREIAVLVDEQKIVGSYQSVFDASAFTSGVYLYRLTSISGVITKRMVLVK